jgi:hypothetical protein
MPSPMRAEYQRCTKDSPALAIDSAAMMTASRTTVAPACGCPPVMAFTTSPARTGVATPMTADTTTVSRKKTMSRR